MNPLNMKNKPLLSTLVIAVIALAAALVFAQQNRAATVPSEQAIRDAVLDVNARMTKAADNLDFDGFFSHILDTDKGSIVQNGTVYKSRQEAMDAVKAGMTGVAKIERRFVSPQVSVISPDVALLTSEGTLLATFTDGRTVDGRFAISMIFVRKDGEWKLLHGHYSAPVRR